MVAKVWSADSFSVSIPEKELAGAGLLILENEISQGGGGGIVGCIFWRRVVFWEPFDGLGYAFGARFNDEGLVTAIVKC